MISGSAGDLIWKPQGRHPLHLGPQSVATPGNLSDMQILESKTGSVAQHSTLTSPPGD